MSKDITANARHAAAFLKGFAHPGRLAVLCALAEGERSAGDLQAVAGLSQTALSQHLARLRADGFVANRRAGTTLYYRLKDPKAKGLIKALHKLFCK